MALEEIYANFLKRLPGVAEPVGRLSFKAKMKWTGLMLLIYFFMRQSDRQVFELGHAYAPVDRETTEAFRAKTEQVGPAILAIQS